MADYANEIDDRLDCPKCNKRLRHIGVDYDKPSVIHTCKNCSHKFQDFHVNAKCLSCTNDKSVESLNSRIINSYKLTKKGELAAVKGFVTTTKDFDEVIGTIKYDTFKTMLKYEIERLKQTNGNSNICAINIANSSSVYSKLGSDLQKGLLKDLVSVIRSNIRTSDIISFESSSTIVLSMNDIPTKIANKILNEMVLILKDLIKSGFNNLEVAFDVRVAKIDSKISHETQLNDLIKDFA
jgi:GGDEF domain-containing protein